MGLRSAAWDQGNQGNQMIHSIKGRFGYNFLLVNCVFSYLVGFGACFSDIRKLLGGFWEV